MAVPLNWVGLRRTSCVTLALLQRAAQNLQDGM
jgi:hypothetical protein